jgi:hypothetical protein
MTVTRVFPLVAFCLGCVSPRASEMPPAHLADSLRASDTVAVLALAAEFGIPNPAGIRYRFMYPSGQLVGCPVLTVESPVTVDGNRRSWVELVVRRKGRDTGGHRCQVPDPSEATVKHEARWVASSAERTDQTLWRVHDGDWQADITLGTNVSYDSATLIVQAVRRRTLVNQIPAVLRRLFGDTLPVVDASDIRAITRSHRETHVYEVRTGQMHGYVLSVSIVAGQVLVHNIGSWIS